MVVGLSHLARSAPLFCTCYTEWPQLCYMAGFPGGDYLEALGVVLMQSMGVRGSGIILHANNVIPVMLSLSECYVPGYTLLLCRISAAELLQLDFFNEWSVHLDCSWTSQRDVLQFRIRDDVIRTKNHQKEGEAIQFDFNLNDDEPREMAAELVRVSYCKVSFSSCYIIFSYK